MAVTGAVHKYPSSPEHMVRWVSPPPLKSWVVLGQARWAGMGRDGWWMCQELLGGVSKLAPLDPHLLIFAAFSLPLSVGRTYWLLLTDRMWTK